jgi:hypothetical protein
VKLNVRYGMALIFVTTFGTSGFSAPSEAERAPHEYRLVRPEGGVPKGFTWHKQLGADFAVFKAVNGENGDSPIGIYVGLHPSFRGADASCHQTGTVAGKPVTWCPLRAAGDDGSSLLAVQTLLEYSPCDTCLPLRLHIWAGAKTRGDLDDLQRRLETLKLIDDPSDHD